MKTSVDIASEKQVLHGPCGVKLVLDASQYFPDNPGEGTPILFEYENESMSWGCAFEGGNLDDILPSTWVSVRVWPWVKEIEESVYSWQEKHCN